MSKSTAYKSPVEQLIAPVARQGSGIKDLRSIAPDVCNNGADCGVNGFTYYTDTVAFATRQKGKIFALIREQIAQFGRDDESIASFVQGFRCLRNYTIAEVENGLYSPKSGERTQVFNALAWYALEEVCRHLVDLSDS